MNKRKKIILFVCVILRKLERSWYSVTTENVHMGYGSILTIWKKRIFLVVPGFVVSSAKQRKPPRKSAQSRRQLVKMCVIKN